MSLNRARKSAKRQDYPLLLFGEGGRPYFCCTRYALTGLTGSPRPDTNIIPLLTDLQADALDTVHFIAAENSLGLPQRKGDIHLINNRAHFHAREAYGSHPADHKRHLMRLIIRDSEFGRTPLEKVNERWGNLFNYQHRQGKWALEKGQPSTFTSTSQYEGLYRDSTITHSNT